MPTRKPKIAIALLRGINVGGRAIVPMKQLASCLETLGYGGVRTYIQSGNAVFRCSKKLGTIDADAISDAIHASCGVRPGVQLLSAVELDAVISKNPFPEASQDPSRLHVFFLSKPPKSPRLAALEKLKSSTECYEFSPRAFYLHAPDGVGRSKLAAAVERLLGVSVTARNWRTVEKLREMAAEAGD